MKWIRTSNFLPLYFNVNSPIGDLISSSEYLILIPHGWGWEQKIVSATFKLNKDGDKYLDHWIDKSNVCYESNAPLYWCSIEYPKDAAEILSDWQDDIMDSRLDFK